MVTAVDGWCCNDGESTGVRLVLVSNGESNSDGSWIVQMQQVGTGVMFWWFFSSRQLQ